MKKKVLLVLLLIVSISIYVTINKVKDYNLYSNIIKSNWSIELPKTYKEIYAFNEESSFLGDGKRYHVLEYNNSDEINEVLDWYDEKDKHMEAYIQSNIKKLDVKEDYVPNFENKYKYYYKNDVDNIASKIYIIFDTTLNRLYIFEDIY